MLCGVIHQLTTTPVYPEKPSVFEENRGWKSTQERYSSIACSTSSFSRTAEVRIRFM
jgi:hypothetical protein